jgi:hypothetical protein
MSKPLVTYLYDHLGGAQIAIQLLKVMRDWHDDQRFRDFAGLPRERHAHQKMSNLFCDGTECAIIRLNLWQKR